jgi:metal-responsive CopG/Arc/MetJ family transcriptional regulator
MKNYTNKSSRTQILLPQDLRQKIDRTRQLTGESLGEYLRQAAAARVQKEQKKRIGLNQLARQVVGSIKDSSWKSVDVVKWQRNQRKDRT